MTYRTYEEGGRTAKAIAAADELNRTPTTTGGFWGDIDPMPPRIERWKDRVFIDAATDCNDRRITGAKQPWATTSYANWAPRDSSLGVMSSRGALAITGMSRSSDTTARGGTGGSTVSTMGVGGFAIVDRPGSTGRGLYADTQFEAGASYSYGVEIAAKNKGANVTSTPYTLGLGVYGIYNVAGGDDSYGGAATNPSNTAMLVAKGSQKWNKGIVFGKDSLTGADGTGDTVSAQRNGVAVEMAVGHLIRWIASNGNLAGTLSATAPNSDGSKSMQILMQDNTIFLLGNSGSGGFRAQHQNNAVNGVSVSNGLTGTPAKVSAYGPDTDIDLTIAGQNAGVINFGYAGAAATAAASFSATQRIKVKINGVVGYIPFSPTAW